MIKCITFDLDDTLWKIEPVITRAEVEFQKSQDAWSNPSKKIQTWDNYRGRFVYVPWAYLCESHRHPCKVDRRVQENRYGSVL